MTEVNHQSDSKIMVQIQYMGFWSQCQKNAIRYSFGFGWRSFGTDTDTEIRYRFRFPIPIPNFGRTLFQRLIKIAYFIGLRTDIVQHGLLLPVLVNHLRLHASLDFFEQSIGYTFKNRSLLQLAMTHPSYKENYGTNPDHCR